MSKLGLGVASLCAASAMAVAYAAVHAMAESQAGIGLFTAIAGGAAALVLGGGLAALQFWSQRQGFDERAGARPDVARRDIGRSD
jgi:hypothetical protein